MKAIAVEDRFATQEQVILGALIKNCGMGLSPRMVEKIMEDIKAAMREDGVVWAFLPGDAR